MALSNAATIKNPKGVDFKARTERALKSKQENNAVEAYLAAIAADESYRSKPRNVENRIARINETLQEKGLKPLEKLDLLQKRRDLTALLEGQGVVDMETLEANFIKEVASYSERKGISYVTWREVGVPASVLKAAGIQVTRK